MLPRVYVTCLSEDQTQQSTSADEVSVSVHLLTQTALSVSTVAVCASTDPSGWGRQSRIVMFLNPIYGLLSSQHLETYEGSFPTLIVLGEELSNVTH